ncbi:LytR/AlgR family response regulator transcription factor [Spirosoma validum]|uniref:Response regulator transcription factor n=1 Tax=Spirosoma validum TaxID=2771355 RepID=A0A927GDI0_9BACT|nr:LytTR family DNA-binding domain-containing protein [Spirosoma validum]MBD2753581.1 response regulator transcription factor [Spirosoma validum]
MTALIIDDEKHCRDVLSLLLKRYCPIVQIAATCANGAEGQVAIETLRPDLVFLDIEMPGMNGFDMLEACRYTDFQVIFTTAFNEYAIKAIRHNALDYILKPVDKDELIHAVAKAQQKQNTQSPSGIEQLLGFLQNQNVGGRISLPTLEGLQIIDSEDIYYCESDGGYTRFAMKNGQIILISKTLKEVEEVLDTKGFCRVHHSYLINLRYVQRYIRGDGGEVVMANNKALPVSRNKKQEFLSLLEKI